jgi:hypothetical protein
MQGALVGKTFLASECYAEHSSLFDREPVGTDLLSWVKRTAIRFTGHLNFGASN